MFTPSNGLGPGGLAGLFRQATRSISLFRCAIALILFLNNTRQASQRCPNWRVTLLASRIWWQSAFKRYDEQIAILRARGLQVGDVAFAKHILTHYSYYRLSAYRFPFQDTKDQFRHGTTFEELWALYVFDRKLRALVGEACKHLEVSVRATWAYIMGESHGPDAYEQGACFRHQRRYQANLDSLDRLLGQSQEPFVSHYRNQHGMNRPPIWCVTEVMSFGLLSRFYANTAADRDKKAVARIYGLSINGFESLLEHTVYLRNLSAHHARLWNRQFTVTVSLPQKQPNAVVKSLNPQEPRRLYNSLVLLGHVVQVVAPESDWLERVRAHVLSLPVKMQADMGFPRDWESRPVWL
ncbi:MAG: Abi family protein [Verrucomicrobiota bacterium JB022]|nr:Abi family protein [Verrucomicrobiota bacterium JB022]